MKLHKEGIFTIFTVLIIGLCICILSNKFLPKTVTITLFTIYLSIQLIVIYFFRNPTNRIPVVAENAIISPADGTIVAIEKVMESEFFKDERIQVSVFMSVFNVHKNFFPSSGKIIYYRHHNGQFKRAVLPKSSTENERSTIVIKNDRATILFRQIAGAMARRIVTYTNEGETALQSQEVGFIKFGSRVDVFLPLNANINVKLGDKTVGSQTTLATL